MIMSSNGNIFRVTGHLCGEFTGPGEFPAQRAVTRRFDVFFDLRLNQLLSKPSWDWWFETLSCPLWRHYNDFPTIIRLRKRDVKHIIYSRDLFIKHKAPVLALPWRHISVMGSQITGHSTFCATGYAGLYGKIKAPHLWSFVRGIHIDLLRPSDAYMRR